MSMSMTAGGGRQHTDPARDGWKSSFTVHVTAPRNSGIRIQTQSADVSVIGVAERIETRTASGEFVPLRGRALLGWNRFVDVSRHKEVMSCGRSMTRIFVGAMHASGVHLQAIGCGFRRLL